MKRTLLFTAIASVLATGAYATSATVTSKNYVDAADALKQDKITAGTTGNVVTYNGTQNGQAQFSERGIFNPETGFDENYEVVSGHEDDLVTADSIFPDVNDIYNQVGDIYNQVGDIYNQINGLEQATNNLPQTTVTYKTCTEWVSGQLHTDANCILWNLSDTEVYGCRIDADCNDCTKMCSEGKCVRNPNAVC